MNLFRPITEEEFFDAVEEELDKRDKLEEENAESSRLKNEPTTPNEHHLHTIGLDFKIRVSLSIDSFFERYNLITI